MRYKKIINDPVYGFISIPDGLIYNLIEHPFFQRLRYIKQVGLSHYVYPGALHTRFHHAIGAMHLALRACSILRNKGIEISENETESLAAAMLLHDIGHGPFSHALEYKLVGVSHEEISLIIMHQLNEEFNGALNTCIDMYRGNYHRKFFRQLIRSQLDLDRLDYLARDSFFTGVTEGQVSYDRILHMLQVYEDTLVVEEKGIYSIEKFLIARRLMYWQVYLHKTVLSAEQMLIKLVDRIKLLLKSGVELPIRPLLHKFLNAEVNKNDFVNSRQMLFDYCHLDDQDLHIMVKDLCGHPDKVLSYISKSLKYRKLFKLEFIHGENTELLRRYRNIAQREWKMTDEELEFLIFAGKESNVEYNSNTDEILILNKNGEVEPISALLDFKLKNKALIKNYICYPKNIVTLLYQ
jgi:hypothetical protein